MHKWFYELPAEEQACLWAGVGTTVQSVVAAALAELWGVGSREVTVEDCALQAAMAAMKSARYGEIRL